MKALITCVLCFSLSVAHAVPGSIDRNSIVAEEFERMLSALPTLVVNPHRVAEARVRFEVLAAAQRPLNWRNRTTPWKKTLHGRAIELASDFAANLRGVLTEDSPSPERVGRAVDLLLRLHLATARNTGVTESPAAAARWLMVPMMVMMSSTLVTASLNNNQALFTSTLVLTMVLGFVWASLEAMNMMSANFDREHGDLMKTRRLVASETRKIFWNEVERIIRDEGFPVPRGDFQKIVADQLNRAPGGLAAACEGVLLPLGAPVPRT